MVMAVLVLTMYPAASIIRTTAYTTFVADTPQPTSSSNSLFQNSSSVSSLPGLNASDLVPHFTSENSLITGNASCPVLSPFDHTCGFAVSPPAWATAYPGYNVPIEYFDDGLYGVVWLNATAFNIIKPMVVQGGLVPAICQIALPSGTVVTNHTMAELPNNQNVTLQMSSAAICSTRGIDFEDSATYDNPSVSMSVVLADFEAPGLPPNCGDCSIYGPAFWSSLYAGQTAYFGQLATDSTCVPNYCSTYAWTLLAGWYAVTDRTASIISTNCPGNRNYCGETANAGDQMVEEPSESYTTSGNPFQACGQIEDSTNGNVAYLCQSETNSGYELEIFMNDYDNSCSDYPSSLTTYNSIELLDSSSNQIYLSFSTNWNGNCGDDVIAYPGYDASVEFYYDTT